VFWFGKTLRYLLRFLSISCVAAVPPDSEGILTEATKKTEVLRFLLLNSAPFPGVSYKAA
jgi:hypothetical protein